MGQNQSTNNALQVGFYASLSLVILTLITFGFAMMAIPPSGPYCPGDCMSYPYADILSYYPRDYYWMYFAVFQLFAFLVFMASNHCIAPAQKSIFSFISVVFAIVSATILLADYFMQFSVVPISIMKGETEGIALLTQYNGHGVFIVLEELGYTVMSLALLSLAPIFNGKSTLEKAIKWILIMPFVLTLISFVFYTVKFGLDRDYRFEVATITVNWLALIVTGILISIFIKRAMKALDAKPDKK
jgi:hypothetical protein